MSFGKKDMTSLLEEKGEYHKITCLLKRFYKFLLSVMTISASNKST